MSNNLDKAIDDLNKKFGKLSVTTVDSKEIVEVDAISSGSIGIDAALGIGGWPRGRIIELFGWESSGKTTLALHAIAECQRAGGKAAMIDAEHAFDPSYAKALGIDLSSLLLAQPSCGEEALEIADSLIKTHEIALLVVDSVAALVPRSEIDGDMGDSNMGVHARLMSQAMRKLTPITGKSNTCVIFINQLREKIGVMFGNPQTTTGGNALKFYASIRVEVKKAAQPVKDSDGLASATSVSIKVVKNKVASPFKEAKFEILYGKGINRNGELFDMGLEAGVIEKHGSWYSYDDSKIGQGRVAAIETLNDNPDLVDEIESIVVKGSKSKK